MRRAASATAGFRQTLPVLGDIRLAAAVKNRKTAGARGFWVKVLAKPRRQETA